MPPVIQLRTAPRKSYVSSQSDMRNGITAPRTRLLPNPALRYPPSGRQFTSRQNLIKRPFGNGVLAPQLFSTRFHSFAPKNLRCTSVPETTGRKSPERWLSSCRHVSAVTHVLSHPAASVLRPLRSRSFPATFCSRGIQFTSMSRDLNSMNSRALARSWINFGSFTAHLLLNC
jgi:hypothetical protein